jgi:hypothetical protein
VPDHVPYSATLVDEDRARRGERGAARVKGKADVTPRRKKSNLDDLKEL